MATDEQIEKAAQAIKQQKKRVLTRDMVGEFTRLEWEQARAALEAVETETLEDVLSGWDGLAAHWEDGVFVVDVCRTLWGDRGQTIGRQCAQGEGTTIDEAIRNAVKAATNGS